MTGKSQSDLSQEEAISRALVNAMAEIEKDNEKIATLEFSIHSALADAKLIYPRFDWKDNTPGEIARALKHLQAEALNEISRLQTTITCMKDADRLFRACQSAVDAFAVVAKTGRCALGGEQNGNWEHCEWAWSELQAAIGKGKSVANTNYQDR